jgi:hypothetical protein
MQEPFLKTKFPLSKERYEANGKKARLFALVVREVYTTFSAIRHPAVPSGELG